MGRNRMVYTPAPFVCTDVITEVAVFSAVTLAPDTTAPLGSITTPVMAPVTVCPSAKGRHRTVIKQHPTRQRKKLLLLMITTSCWDILLAPLSQLPCAAAGWGSAERRTPQHLFLRRPRNATLIRS